MSDNSTDGRRQKAVIRNVKRKMKKKETWGSLAVAAAYASWGLLTIFWNLLAAVNSIYVLAQRIIWSMIFMAVYMGLLGKWQEIYKYQRQKEDCNMFFMWRAHYHQLGRLYLCSK